MELTVVLKLKLLDELVELTLHKVDLPPKDTDTLTASRHGCRAWIIPLQARSSDQDAL